MKTKKLNKNLVIDRRKWLRGCDDSKLYDSETRRMCCLGFCAIQNGFRKKDIKDHPYPSDIDFKPLLDNNGRWRPTTEKLMEVNDNTKIDDSVREKKIISLFKRFKVRVKFIN